MNSEEVVIEDKKKKKGLLSKLWSIKIVKIIVVVCLIVLFVAIGFKVKSDFFTDGQTTNMGFEDIGELATQAANTTEIQVTEKARDFFGTKIPFTKTKVIYSYQVKIKAGYDFGQIKWEKRDDVIYVQLPKVKVLSSEIDYKSFKVYHEDESIFSPITMEENNKAVLQMKERAEKNAIKAGLFEEAEENAKRMLEPFFKQNSEYAKCTIKFEN